jgi:type II secretory pathway component PulF
MLSFRYEAYNKEGLKIEGVMEAPSIPFVKANLKREGLVPVRVEESGEERPLLRHLKLKRRVGLSQLEFFSSEISILLKNGIKVDRAIDIVRKGVKEEAFRRIVESVYAEIRHGVPLSKALAKESEVFNPLYVTLVSIGEKTGKLAEAFSDLERNLKFQKQLASKVKQAVFYPAFILLFCVLALVFIFNFIIPRFSALFDTGAQIPFYTQLLMDFSSFFRAYQLPIYLGFAAFLLLLPKLARTEAFKKAMDYALYRAPGVNSLLLNLENLRFSSALRVLLQNNVVIDEALGYAVDAVGNRYLRNRIRFLQADIKKGVDLSQVLTKTYFIPTSFISLIEVGEHSGNLGEIFQELEERFRIRFEENVVRFTTIIEPLLILMMGCIVGSIVIAMLMSIISIQDISV